MRGKLKLVKGGATRRVLVYGMRLIETGRVAALDDAKVKLADGEQARVTMHIIEGTDVQIRRQLLRSIDAFFELLAEPGR